MILKKDRIDIDFSPLPRKVGLNFPCLPFKHVVGVLNKKLLQVGIILENRKFIPTRTEWLVWMVDNKIRSIAFRCVVHGSQTYSDCFFFVQSKWLKQSCYVSSLGLSTRWVLFGNKSLRPLFSFFRFFGPFFRILLTWFANNNNVVNAI